MFKEISMGLVGASMMFAPAAHASETRSYVVQLMAPAMNSVEGDCPRGINPDPDELFRSFLVLQDVPVEQHEELVADWRRHFRTYAPNRGRINGEPVNVYIHPLSVPDPEISTVEHTEGLGFNLDGQNDPEDFVDPLTGETGVDNEESRVMGCYSRLRSTPEYAPSGGVLLWNGVREGMPAWVIEVTGIDDLENDDDVSVQIFRAFEPVTKDATGESQSYMTYTVDPDERMQDNIFHGSIEDGVFTSDEPIDFFMVAESYIQPEFNLLDARLRFRFDGEDLRLMLGGYGLTAMTYLRYAQWGEGQEGASGMNIPGIFYALRRLADGPVNPETGVRDRISTTQQIWAIPAFIERSDGTNIATAANGEGREGAAGS